MATVVEVRGAAVGLVITEVVGITGSRVARGLALGLMVIDVVVFVGL